MSCKQKQSGQGAYRNGRKPNLHQGVPGVEHFNDKRRYFKKSLAARRAEVIAETKEWLDWTAEELDGLLNEEWHELDAWDKISLDCLPENLGEGNDG